MSRNRRDPSRRPSGKLARLLLATSMLGVVVAEAQAQQVQTAPLNPPPAAQQRQAPPKQATPAAQPKVQTPPKQDTADAGTARGEAALRQRIEQLEEQLTDLQVSVGTLDSLAKGGGGGASAAARLPAAGGGGADAARVDALEQQVRAMATQLDQLTQQVRAMSGGQPATRIQSATVAPPAFGSTTVTQGNDPIGQIIGSGNTPQGAAATPPAQPGASDASARQIYEAGRSQLLQRDYAAAEASFDEFVRRFPSDQLAGDAQYWLGESHFVRGQFKAAAGAFLKGYKTYPRSPKAADSLMMLAISLDRLGQRDDACAMFSELATRFPGAPGYVKNRSDQERRRIGCA